MVPLTARKKSYVTHHHALLGYRGVNLHLVRLLVVEEQELFHPRVHLHHVMVITSSFTLKRNFRCKNHTLLQSRAHQHEQKKKIVPFRLVPVNLLLVNYYFLVMCSVHHDKINFQSGRFLSK